MMTSIQLATQPLVLIVLGTIIVVVPYITVAFCFLLLINCASTSSSSPKLYNTDD
jgi:hypothetical protein